MIKKKEKRTDSERKRNDNNTIPKLRDKGSKFDRNYLVHVFTLYPCKVI